MSKYYTNVNRWGNTLFVRGISDGKEFRDKLNYSPTLYIESKKETGVTSLYGTPLKPTQFDKMQEATEFAKKHEDTNLKLYGFPLFHSSYINETFPNAEKTYNRDEIRTFNIDIEVTSNEGFPTAKEAAYPVTAICIHDNISYKYVTLGDNDWDSSKSELPQEIIDKVVYIKCSSEHDLLTKFLKFWKDNCPHVVTGWNVAGFDM